MFFDRRSAIRSLRFRLAAWNALAVALTALVTLFTVRVGVAYILLNEADQVLLDDLHEIELMLGSMQAESPEFLAELDRKARGHTHHRWFVQILDDQNRERWASLGRPERLKSAGAGLGETPASTHGFRVLRQTIAPPRGRRATIRVGSSLEFIEADLARIDRSAIAAGAVILIASPVAGFWLAGRATRPLNVIIRTAAAIRPDRINERLPIRGSGDELDLLSQTINELLDRIAVYLDHHRQFVANAAHELRSPLAALKNAAEVSLAKHRTVEEYENLMHDLIAETDALSSLVNQLLLLAECETDRLRIRGPATSLEAIVGRSIEMLETVAESRGLAIVARRLDPAWVEADAKRLRQVVHNVLDNAIKYSPPGGTIEITLAHDPQARQARLVVRDMGIGIGPDDLPRVFERFYRADHSRQRCEPIPGTGLGLSIVQAIVTALGGTIELESQPGSGTTVRLALPTCPAPLAAGRAAGSARA